MGKERDGISFYLAAPGLNSIEFHVKSKIGESGIGGKGGHVSQTWNEEFRSSRNSALKPGRRKKSGKIT